MKKAPRILFLVTAWVCCFSLITYAALQGDTGFPSQGQADSLNSVYDIRVLVVYTKAAREASSTNQIKNRIQDAVTKTNQSFIDSGIRINLVLADRREIQYTETGDLGADLDALVSTSGGVLDEIHTWRDESYADLVSLVVSYGDRCYEGRLLTSADDPNFEAQAFSVVRYDCMVIDLGFPMGLGKNLGARLDWYYDEGVLPFTDSHGYIFIPEPAGSASGWRTMMTSNDLCTVKGVFCEHLWRWSNSQVRYETDGTWMGVPAGTNASCHIGVDNNPPCDADNARVLNQTASLVANFRPEPPPTPEILLVNDEGLTEPEVEHYYVEALQALQKPFDIWRTGSPGYDEPTEIDLASYRIMIWFTGRNTSEASGPSSSLVPDFVDTEKRISSWLTSENCFLILSPDYYFPGSNPTAFMQEMLGVLSINVDVTQTEITGLGPFSGMGTKTLDGPAEYNPSDWNHNDAIQPGPGSVVAFVGDQGAAGVSKMMPDYRTSYLAFPLEMLPEAQDRVMLLEQFLATCQFMKIYLPAIRVP